MSVMTSSLALMCLQCKLKTASLGVERKLIRKEDGAPKYDSEQDTADVNVSGVFRRVAIHLRPLGLAFSPAQICSPAPGLFPDHDQQFKKGIRMPRPCPLTRMCSQNRSTTTHPGT